MMFTNNFITVSQILIIYFLQYVNCNDSEIFSSTTKMENSFINLKRLTATLEDYIQNEKTRLNSLRRSVQNLKILQSHYLPREYDGDMARHFSFSGAFVSEWNRIDTDVNDRKSQDIHNQIMTIRNALPSQHYKSELVLGIARLQTNYNISAVEFANGDVFGFKLHKLSVLESYHIGRQMFKRRFYRLALDWFHVTLKKLESCQECDLTVHKEYPQNISFELTREKIEEEKKVVLETIRQTKKSLPDLKASYERQLERIKDNDVLVDILTEYIQKIETGKYEYVDAEYKRNLDASIRQEILCKDNTTYTKASQNLPTSLAKCHYLLHLPRFQPMKLEVISQSPVLVIVHGILTDKEMEKIKADNINKMTRSTVLLSDGSKKITDEKFSQSVELESRAPASLTYHRRLEALLNMALDPEEFLVTNYAPGGSFQLHVDYIQSKKAAINTSKARTNRLITFLFYLSDVAGGATVFPNVGLKVVPEKGSLTAWMNLNADGSTNKNTLHSGCPVITGSKWILRRYLISRGQNIEGLMKYLLDPLNSN